MSDRLARRYERLLEAYPESYRAERGQEILGTLLEGAKPGQRWPSAREAVALVRGGLWTRLAHSSPSFRAWWYGVLYLAVLLTLFPKVYVQSGNVARIEMELTGEVRLLPVGVNWGWLAVTAVVLLAVLLRAYRIALGVAAVLAVLETVVLGFVSSPTDGGTAIAVNAVDLALLLALLTALAWIPAPGDIRRPRAWIALALAVAFAAPPGLPFLLDLMYRWNVVFAFAIMASLLLGLYDVRVPAAVALYLLGTGALSVTMDAASGGDGSLVTLVSTLVSATLLAGASLVAQRMVVRL
jgi:hypothetical protein